VLIQHTLQENNKNANEISEAIGFDCSIQCIFLFISLNFNKGAIAVDFTSTNHGCDL
jgi:hypothetical protein